MISEEEVIYKVADNLDTLTLIDTMKKVSDKKLFGVYEDIFLSRCFSNEELSYFLINCPLYNIRKLESVLENKGNLEIIIQVALLPKAHLGKIVDIVIKNYSSSLWFSFIKNVPNLSDSQITRLALKSNDNNILCYAFNKGINKKAILDKLLKLDLSELNVFDYLKLSDDDKTFIVEHYKNTNNARLLFECMKKFKIKATPETSHIIGTTLDAGLMCDYVFSIPDADIIYIANKMSLTTDSYRMYLFAKNVRDPEVISILQGKIEGENVLEFAKLPFVDKKLMTEKFLKYLKQTNNYYDLTSFISEVGIVNSSVIEEFLIENIELISMNYIIDICNNNKIDISGISLAVANKIDNINAVMSFVLHVDVSNYQVFLDVIMDKGSNRDLFEFIKKYDLDYSFLCDRVIANKDYTLMIDILKEKPLLLPLFDKVIMEDKNIQALENLKELFPNKAGVYDRMIISSKFEEEREKYEEAMTINRRCIIIEDIDELLDRGLSYMISYNHLNKREVLNRLLGDPNRYMIALQVYYEYLLGEVPGDGLDREYNQLKLERSKKKIRK